MPARPRLAMIGLDAADLGLIEAWGASLPNLARAVEEGIAHPLESPAELLTGSVWPTFSTGTGPGVHGLYHHIQWSPAHMALRRTSSDWLDVEPFWRRLARKGVRGVVCDVPMSLPPLRGEGGEGGASPVEVLEWGAHMRVGTFATRPVSLAREVRRRFGRHPMGLETPLDHSPRDLARIHAELLAGVAKKIALCRWLLARSDWDLFLAVFGESHRGGHLFWPRHAGDERLLAVYRAIDAGVGLLLDDLRRGPATTVALFSVHGMGPNTSQEHLMPRVMDRVNAAFAASRPGRPSRPQRSLARWLRETLPAWSQHAVARAAPVRFRDAVVSAQVSAGLDWGATPGLTLRADETGYLRLNLAGRERAGCLVRGTEDELRYRAFLEECLRSLRDERGAPLVRELRLAQEEFPGPRSALLPDVVVTWTGVPAARRAISSTLGVIEAPPTSGRAGNHRSAGFCSVLGDQGGLPFAPPRRVIDLAAAVGAFFGVDAPA